MKIAVEWRVDQLNIFGHSQLIINQVNDVYQMKDEKLISYEMNYNIIDKAFLAVVFSSKKLRHYMLAHIK